MRIAFITHVYSETPQTVEFYKSCERNGVEVINAASYTGTYKGAGHGCDDILNTLNRIKGEYTHVIYMDGGDSFIQIKPTTVPDHVMYQGEKQCYPHIHLANQHPKPVTQWCFLNGGCFSGSIENVIAFYERCKQLYSSTVENGQHVQQLVMIEWMEQGKEVEIDQRCTISQSLAFSHNNEDFEIEGNLIKNKVTGTYPPILHGNGRTPMEWIYNLYK